MSTLTIATNPKPRFKKINHDCAIYTVAGRRYELSGLTNNRIESCLFTRIEFFDDNTAEQSIPERINLASATSRRNFAKAIHFQLGHQQSFIRRDLEMLLETLQSKGFVAKKNSRPARQFGKSWSRT
jgi:hypothetical protein